MQEDDNMTLIPATISGHDEYNDYIAGMSDIYAIDQFEKLFVPKRWNVY